jgi:hypothetical protein
VCDKNNNKFEPRYESRMSWGRSLSQDLLTAKTTTAKAWIIKNSTRNRLYFKKRTRSVRGSNVWAIQWYQKTYLEVSWDYPFNLQNMLAKLYQWANSVIIEKDRLTYTNLSPRNHLDHFKFLFGSLQVRLVQFVKNQMLVKHRNINYNNFLIN